MSSYIPQVQADGGDDGPSTSGSNVTLDDLEELGVIGSGSSGIAKKVRPPSAAGRQMVPTTCLPAMLTAQQSSVTQVRNKRTGEILVLKVIQFDVSSDTIRKQVRTLGQCTGFCS